LSGRCLLFEQVGDDGGVEQAATHGWLGAAPRRGGLLCTARLALGSLEACRLLMFLSFARHGRPGECVSESVERLLMVFILFSDFEKEVIFTTLFWT